MPLGNVGEFSIFYQNAKKRLEQQNIKEFTLRISIMNNNEEVSYLSITELNDESNIDYYASFSNRMCLVLLIPDKTQYFEKYLK